jgi:hypothetical protein
MRQYAKISPQFWIGDTGRRLREAGHEALLVALYLLTNPHANMLGLYYLPTSFIAHETGLSPEGASKGLRRAIEAGFCVYDESCEMIFIYEMARFQIADCLTPTDKQCAGIQREYEALPNNAFLAVFYEKYVKAFHLTNRRDPRSSSEPPSEAPSKALRSQEQEQEQELDQEIDTSSEEKPSDGGIVLENPKKATKHTAFKELTVRCYEYLNRGEKTPWDGSDARQLSAVIKAVPTLDAEKFHQWLKNYAASENINPAARPRVFLPKITDYAGGPLDKFGRPAETHSALIGSTVANTRTLSGGVQ